MNGTGIFISKDGRIINGKFTNNEVAGVGKYHVLNPNGDYYTGELTTEKKR